MYIFTRICVNIYIKTRYVTGLRDAAGLAYVTLIDVLIKEV